MTKFVFENLYESLRELSEGIILSDGLKIYSHEYTLQYLIYKKHITNEDFNIFNDFRILRNKSKYYGKDISFEKLEESIKNFTKLNNKLKKILKIKLTKSLIN